MHIDDQNKRPRIRLDLATTSADHISTYSRKAMTYGQMYLACKHMPQMPTACGARDFHASPIGIRGASNCPWDLGPVGRPACIAKAAIHHPPGPARPGPARHPIFTHSRQTSINITWSPTHTARATPHQVRTIFTHWLPRAQEWQSRTEHWRMTSLERTTTTVEFGGRWVKGSIAASTCIDSVAITTNNNKTTTTNHTGMTITPTR
jgi:hypothetical protein